MQAHTSDEVGILGTVLLRVCSRTTFAIFIEIGVYLTDKEQKISWHSFFETLYSSDGRPNQTDGRESYNAWLSSVWTVLAVLVDDSPRRRLPRPATVHEVDN